MCVWLCDMAHWCLCLPRQFTLEHTLQPTTSTPTNTLSQTHPPPQKEPLKAVLPHTTHTLPHTYCFLCIYLCVYVSAGERMCGLDVCVCQHTVCGIVIWKKCEFKANWIPYTTLNTHARNVLLSNHLCFSKTICRTHSQVFVFGCEESQGIS